ncbi:MAG: S41 family peptidase [Bacteroidetes bacterium]|nr:S41 family peptidase [Bacteroidota bacterium]
MRQLKYLFTGVLAVLYFSSCTKQLSGRQAPNSATENFEILWKDYDAHYGTFITKNINWQEAYNQFRPMVYDGMPDSSLFSVMKKLLDVLDDNHVFLKPLASTGLPWYKGGVLGRIQVQDYNKEVAQSYLIQKFSYGDAIDYGFLQDNIGYISLKKFDNDFSFYPEAMDAVLHALINSKGIIIDMRENDGGEDRVSQYIANRFASERHFSFSSSLRNGPAHNDFATPIKFYTEPEGSFQYTKPVIIINNLNVYSAGETFVLAMLQNSNVRLTGTVTGGALSDAVERELPNGWLYRVPIADVRDANGDNLEQIGINPSVYVENTTADLLAGKDKMLEKAIELIP